MRDDHTPANGTPSTGDEPIVAIRNLYKIFGARPDEALDLVVQHGVGKKDLQSEQRHVLALRDINLDTHEGKITVIMGLSGSGKSTLIRHLNRLIEPTSGEIRVHGENILDYNEADLRRLRRETMSMVFQNFALLPHKTVLDNVGMALSVRGEDKGEIDKASRYWLDRVGLAGSEDSYPSELSGGMQQRVGLARALASDSPIMLMDEAFSALDPLIRTDMQDLLLELQDELQKTVIFISHDLDEALKLADHLVILKEGFVVQQDEPQRILMQPEDDYIVDFISDINRARVLRVRSVMSNTSGQPAQVAGQVDADDTLEQVLAMSGGDMSSRFAVMREGKQIGILEGSDLIRALVPTGATTDSEARARA